MDGYGRWLCLGNWATCSTQPWLSLTQGSRAVVAASGHAVGLGRDSLGDRGVQVVAEPLQMSRGHWGRFLLPCAVFLCVGWVCSRARCLCRGVSCCVPGAMLSHSAV